MNIAFRRKVWVMLRHVMLRGKVWVMRLALDVRRHAGTSTSGYFRSAEEPAIISVHTSGRGSIKKKHE
jgi:hypothetical protein